MALKITNIKIPAGNTLKGAFPVVSYGSFDFTGPLAQFLSVPNDNAFNIGANDFTVEWWQYQTSFGPAPYARVWEIGPWSGTVLGISLESAQPTMYIWLNGTGYPIDINLIPLNQWNHFAFVRHNGTFTFYLNGKSMSTFSYADNIADSTTPLTIGAESNDTGATQFHGQLTNFHFVNGTALYTQNFNPHFDTIIPVANTKLLLLAESSDRMLHDYSSLNKTVTNNNNTAWSSLTPF